MLIRFLSSNWVAIPVLLLACVAVAVLYLRGRIMEAKIGGSLLGIALVLILWGSRGPGTGVKG
jgi:hypothetical protein